MNLVWLETIRMEKKLQELKFKVHKDYHIWTKEPDAFLRPKWKDKYQIDWCHLCNIAILRCPHCRNISCSGGGCEICVEEQKEFNDYKTRVECYLTEEEIKIYGKCERLKDMIMDSISLHEKEINFQREYDEGYFSQITEELFAKELKNIKK